MVIEKIEISFNVTWTRLNNAANGSYKWGDGKNISIDSNWSKQNVIYRWVKNSTGEIAIVGETERRLTDRVNNYISASPTSGAGATNKKVFNEQSILTSNNDYLCLELTQNIVGYNLNDNRERKWAESLLIGFYRPYLQ